MSVDAQPGLDQLGEATVACRPDAPLRARALVSRWLDGRADAELRADACLLVSELVANSILHADQPAGAPLHITAAALDGLVRVEVRDQGHGPVCRRVPDLREGGFGLNLVEAIAVRWGVDHERGTRVWFELAIAAGPTSSWAPATADVALLNEAVSGHSGDMSNLAQSPESPATRQQQGIR